MNIKDRILIKDQGPFKPGLEFDDGGLHFLLGNPLLAIVDSSNDDSAYNKLSNISSFTDITNVKDEILTSLYFDDLDSKLLINIDLYYILYENIIVQMDYFNFRNEMEYDSELVEKIIFNILPDKYYPWLDLKGTKKLDSNILYIKSNQIEVISNKLCFKHFDDSHPLLDRLILDPVFND